MINGTAGKAKGTITGVSSAEDSHASSVSSPVIGYRSGGQGTAEHCLSAQSVLLAQVASFHFPSTQ